MNDAANHQPSGDIEAEVRKLLHQAAEREASDLHLIPGYPVTYRMHGRLEQVGKPLAPERFAAMIESILPPRLAGQSSKSVFAQTQVCGSGATGGMPKPAEGERWHGESVEHGGAALPDVNRDATQSLEHDGAAPKNFDFSVAVEHKGQPCRFRANVYLAQGLWCACLRHVPNDIPSFDWMGFPEGLAQRLVAHNNGLVIVTGITGSGKSTTLAAMVNLLNEQGGYRVITVEEPIEYVYKKTTGSVITQREVGRDVDSFYDGLKYGLRQDPDVILIGEIRDRDTAQMALSAAETGHLILATLHTRDAKGAITRFVDLFPHEAQDDVRTQLALSLRSVVSQHLLPPASDKGKRVLALEILHVNQPVRVAINFGKIDSIESAIQTGKRDGMMTLDDDLQRLLMAKKITPATARRFAKDPEGFTAT